MFTPSIVGSGLSSWLSFSTTRSIQEKAFQGQALMQRQISRFATAAQETRSSDDLLSNPHALRVVLTSADLIDDVANTFFLRRLLTDDLTNAGALANRLSDSRYKVFAQTFGGQKLETGLLQDPNALAGITQRFLSLSFEQAVGEQSNDHRLALSFERTLPDIATRSSNASVGWFQVMASSPLRTVFQSVFGLPTAFANLDIDRQHVELQSRAERFFGTADLTKISQPENMEKALRTFFVRQEAAALAATSSGAQTALLLLSNART